MAIVFSNFVDNTPNINHCIGYPATYEMQIQLDVLQSSLSDNLYIICKPAQWINATQQPETTGTITAVPTNAYFEYVLRNTTPLATYFEMSFVVTQNSENYRNGRMFIRLTTNSGYCVINIKYYTFALLDTLGYIDNMQITTSTKLLKDNKSNPQILDNTQQDVYNQIRQMRYGLWIKRNSENQYSFARLNHGEQLSFYYQGFFNWQTCVANAMDPTIDSTVSFNATNTVTIPASADMLVYMIDLDGSSTQQYVQNYYDIFNNSASLIPIGPPSSIWPNHNLANNNGLIKNPVVPWNGTIAQFTIDGQQLIIGHRYRIIVVFRDTSVSPIQTYSFISQEIAARSCICLVKPVISEDIYYDYNNTFPYNTLRCGIDERIGSKTLIDFQPYINSRPFASWIAALQSIQVVFYSINDNNPALTHIYYDLSFTPQTNNTISFPSGTLVDFSGSTTTANTLNLQFSWRIRHDNAPNQYDQILNSSSQLPPTATFEWETRIIYILITINFSDASNYSDVFKIEKAFFVKPFADDQFEIRDYANNVLNPNKVCRDENGNFNKIYVSTTDPDTCDYISVLSEEPFPVISKVEHESYAQSTDLVQLTNSIISSQDPAINSFDSAETIIYLNNEDYGNYIFTSIRKCDPFFADTCCYQNCGGVNIWHGYMDFSYSKPEALQILPLGFWGGASAFYNLHHLYRLFHYTDADYEAGPSSPIIKFLNTSIYPYIPSQGYQPFTYNSTGGGYCGFGLLSHWPSQGQGDTNTCIQPSGCIGFTSPPYPIQWRWEDSCLYNPPNPSPPSIPNTLSWMTDPSNFLGNGKAGVWRGPTGFTDLCGVDIGHYVAYSQCWYELLIQVIEVVRPGDMVTQQFSGITGPNAIYITQPGFYSMVNQFGYFFWVPGPTWYMGLTHGWWNNEFYGTFRIIHFKCLGSNPKIVINDIET